MRLKKVNEIDDAYSAIVKCLATPKTANQIVEELRLIKGSVHAMLKRLVKYGAIQRATSRNHEGFLYTRMMPSVMGEQVLKFCAGVDEVKKSRNGNPMLKPTLPGARVVDFSRKDLTEKLLETQRMTNKERRVRKMNASTSMYSMFDLY